MSVMTTMLVNLVVDPRPCLNQLCYYPHITIFNRLSGNISARIKRISVHYRKSSDRMHAETPSRAKWWQVMLTGEDPAKAH